MDALLQEDQLDAIIRRVLEKTPFGPRGYGELLLGRPEAALRSVDKALAALPDQGFALGTLRAVVLLASGRKDEAGAALETAISHTLRHPLASDPISFRTITKNLEQWNEVATVDGLAPMIRRLKEAAVCVSVLQSTGPKETKAEAVPPRFVAPVYDQRGEGFTRIVNGTVDIGAFEDQTLFVQIDIKPGSDPNSGFSSWKPATVSADRTSLRRAASDSSFPEATPVFRPRIDRTRTVASGTRTTSISCASDCRRSCTVPGSGRPIYAIGPLPTGTKSACCGWRASRSGRMPMTM